MMGLFRRSWGVGVFQVLVVVGWLYVVLMMSLAEALSSQGTLLGAFFTFVLYGILPLSLLLYILGTPARKRALRAREAASSGGGDGSGHAPGGAAAPVAPEGKEP